MPRVVNELSEKKKYIGTIPPKKPYKGNIKFKLFKLYWNIWKNVKINKN